MVMASSMEGVELGQSLSDSTLDRRKSTMMDKRNSRPGRRRVNTLLFLTEKIGPDVLPYLLQNPELNLKAVSESPKDHFQTYLEDGVDIDGVQWFENSPQDLYRNHRKMQGHQLARWADVLFIVMDASMISLMLSGYTTDVILHVLRCWDTSKRIVMLPEMSTDEWKHPLWKRQLSKLERRWDWVHVLQPALWDFSEQIQPEPSGSEVEVIWRWDGPEEIIEAIHSEIQSLLRGSQHSISPSSHSLALRNSSSTKPKLPVEIWTTILDYLGDWELATALGIYTHIPTPYEWQPHIPRAGKPKSFEYTILTQPLPQVRSFFTSPSPQQPHPTTVSALATKIIFKHSLTPILTYLAMHQKDIFWTSFGVAMLPHKASIIYNSPQVLQWWLDCPAVIKKEYGPEALDGASRAGFVPVLDWWAGSGLKLWYTEKALESASAKGHVNVLEWWKKQSELRAGSGPENELPLKVGKSVLLAAQSGRTAAIAWWEASGIPYAHESDVARLASMHGHVDVLELWHSLKGSKMIFDHQVLVGATKNGHAGVLEWWKEASRKSGFVVEYKTCDIEEAMEDAVGGGGESEVREWWGRNGLNLGVGTGEWMKVKSL